MQTDPRIAAIVDELQAWPGPRIAGHRSAAQFFHKLAFLADLGIGLDEPGVATIVEKILDSIDADGVPTLPLDIGAAHGGNGEAVGGWALCDAPVILRALKRLGVDDPRIDRCARFLAGLPRPGGYGCAASKNLGDWRGPGKKTDPCPYATLVMLKLPFVWYDILHVADALSKVEGLREDRRLAEMVGVIEARRKPGGFVPESAYQAWKDWDFGQKKTASRRMTEIVDEIEERLKWKN
jgi:hypothetical protein